jgi:hypothetical protein
MMTRMKNAHLMVLECIARNEELLHGAAKN